MDARSVYDETRPFNAAEIGNDFVDKYFTVLNRTPEMAGCFYAARGHYRVNFPDGTAVVTDDRTEMCRALTRGVSPDAGAVVANTVVSGPCDPSSVRLLVMAAGDRFAQSFVVEHRPAKNGSYTVVSSIATFLTAGTPEDRRPPVKSILKRAPRTPEDRPLSRSTGVQNTTGRTSSEDVFHVPTPGTAGPRVPAGASSKLFVGRLPKTVTHRQLSDVFRVYGRVTDVKIMGRGYNRHNVVSAGFDYGFVSFDRPASAGNALAARPIRLDDGHVLNVNLRLETGNRR